MKEHYNTREKILNSAKALISQRGYVSSSMRQIAKKAGVTTGGIYNYFQSKTDILLEIQTQFLDDVLESIEEFPAESSAPKKIENVIKTILKAINNHKLSYKIMVDEFYHFPRDQQEMLNRKGAKLEKAIKKIIKEGLRNREFEGTSEESPMPEKLYVKMLAFMVLGTCNYATRWLDDKGQLSHEEIGALFSRTILGGLSVTKKRK